MTSTIVASQEVSVADGTPAIRLLHDVVGPEETLYVAVENAPASLATISIHESGNAYYRTFIYLDWYAPADDLDRWYALSPPKEGEYDLHLNTGYESLASLPFRVGDVSRVARKAFADTLLDYSAAGASSFYEEPYGMLAGKAEVKPVDPAIVLGDPGPGPFRVGSAPNLQFLALPKGSSVTVGFSEVRVVDGPGPDLLVRTVEPNDSAGEMAEVHVSTDLQEFHQVAMIYEGGAQLLDLEGLRLDGPVSAVRVTGLDLRGRIPGFDLISVEALNFEELDMHEFQRIAP